VFSKLRKIVMILAAAALASCGGGGGTITSPGGGGGGGGGPSTAASIQLLAGSPQLSSDQSGGEMVEITAIVQDANNVLLPDVLVNFSANSGGTIAVTNAITDDTGVATARLGHGSNLANRPITVTATSGSASSTVVVNVVGTNLSVDCLPDTIQSGATAACNVVLKDSKGVGISGQTVAVTSANGNTLSAASLTTGGGGAVSFNVTGVADGADTITATALGATAQETVTVQADTGAALVITEPDANGLEIPLGVAQNVTAIYTVDGVPTGATVTFTSTRGTLSQSSVVTPDGTASVTISSNTSGTAVITASVGGVTVATRNVEFVATVPNTLDLQADPFTVRVNQQSAITAIVRDANNNPVKNQVVAFQIPSGPGSLTVAQSTTDSQGRATTVYTAGDTSTPVNGVTLRAHVVGTSPEVADTVSLTVSGQALAISLGTGNTLFEIGTATFAKEWVVFVTDADGNAVTNKQVQVSIRSVNYKKGYMDEDGNSWFKAAEAVCPDEDGGLSNGFGALNGILDTEDANGNGVLDDGEDTLIVNGILDTEDANGSGLLEAGNIALVAAVPTNAPAGSPCATAGTQGPAANVVTDSQGRARVCVFYPQNYNWWLDVRIAAKASVSGTEFSKSQTFELEALAADINNVNADPPGVVSPFGPEADCSIPPPP
jgi:hypothetical protein